MALPVTELIRIRTSRRTYINIPLPDDLLVTIEQMIRAIPPGPLGSKIEYSLVNPDDAQNRKLKPGTYGFIRGARHFIVGLTLPGKEAFLDFGFTFEKMILELTGMDLGTCWLGGTFDRGEFARAIHLKEGHVIPAISPVGFAADSMGLGERLIRLGAGSKNRAPFETLFYDRTPATPLVLTEGDPLKSILESVRLAPSASNNQPWRIVRQKGTFQFHLCRKPGYQKAFSQIDLQMTDMGIAMSHFDLAAREYGFSPRWEIIDDSRSHPGWEYVISVFLRV